MKRPDYIEITRALVRYRMDDTKGMLPIDDIDARTTKTDRIFTLQLLRLYATVTQRKPIGER